jgi:hypothetical protein
VVQEVVKVIKPFLEFLEIFDSRQVHSMFALILDPYFKSLWVAKNYVGCGNVIHLVVEYDARGRSPSNGDLW